MDKPILCIECLRHTPARSLHVWHTLEGNAHMSLAPSVSARRLPLIYFERTERTTAEGTFILDRAVCLLDIVDEERSTDVSGVRQKDCPAQKDVRTAVNSSVWSRDVMIRFSSQFVLYTMPF